MPKQPKWPDKDPIDTEYIKKVERTTTEFNRKETSGARSSYRGRSADGPTRPRGPGRDPRVV